MPVQFPAVKAVLDTILVDWTAGNGAPPDLIGNHGGTFLLDTREHLLAAFAKGLPLIQPEIIGQAGQGATANIVIALTIGVTPFPPMPDGGLGDNGSGRFLDPTSPEIQTIVAWIESGCLP